MGEQELWRAVSTAPLTTCGSRVRAAAPSLTPPPATQVATRTWHFPPRRFSAPDPDPGQGGDEQQQWHQDRSGLPADRHWNQRHDHRHQRHDGSDQPDCGCGHVCPVKTQTGYTASAWVCTGGTQSGSSITLANGDNATCTITNDDNAPHLTLVKHVVNDNGGTKTITDFPLTATGPATIAGVSGNASVTNAVVSAGSYHLTEVNQAGYTASAWTCTGGTQLNSSITLALGESATCEITNDDVAPKLKLVKTVINDNGGTKVVSDFVLSVDATTIISGVSNTFSAGAHTASEVNLPGYAASAWAGDCAANGTITLAPGDDKTCTITNDDQAANLILVKNTVGSLTEPFAFTYISGTDAPVSIPVNVTGGTARCPSRASLQVPSPSPNWYLLVGVQPVCHAS